MHIDNLFENDVGVSHFRDIDVAWEDIRPSDKFSAREAASGIIFRETIEGFTVDWHPAPRRQYVINLDAAVIITADDGETRFIPPGEIVLVEDTTGRGHISKFVGGAMRRSIFAALD